MTLLFKRLTPLDIDNPLNPSIPYCHEVWGVSGGSPQLVVHDAERRKSTPDLGNLSRQSGQGIDKWPNEALLTNGASRIVFPHFFDTKLYLSSVRIFFLSYFCHNFFCHTLSDYNGVQLRAPHASLGTIFLSNPSVQYISYFIYCILWTRVISGFSGGPSLVHHDAERG